MASDANESRNERIKLYDKLIASHPEIKRKGKTMPYTSHNGHMFSIMSKEGTLGLRLPKEEREAFLQEHQTVLLEQYGAVMREYVAVPDDLLENTEELLKYLEVSYGYVRTLKPKATKK